MTYSGLSIFASTLALLFAVLSIGMPQWTQDNDVPVPSYNLSTLIQDIKYRTGVWGLCVHVDYTPEAAEDFGTDFSVQCYHFFTSSMATYLVYNQQTQTYSLVTTEQDIESDFVRLANKRGTFEKKGQRYTGRIFIVENIGQSTVRERQLSPFKADKNTTVLEREGITQNRNTAKRF